MPDLATLLDQGASTWLCRKCNTDKPLVDENGKCQFVVKKDRRYGTHFVSHECQACRRAREKKNRQSPEFRARQAAYNRESRKKAKAKLAAMLPAHREYLELVAPIPATVIQRFLFPMLADAAVLEEQAPAEDVAALAAGRYPESGSVWGTRRVARRTGVAERTLNRILDATYKSVDLEIADKLATAGDFSLNELTDAAREWALLNGDPWPLGYRGMATVLKDLVAGDLEAA